MGEHTEIGWTDHTFNPWHGCTKVSPACDNCYAEAFSKRTGRAEWGDDAPRWFPSEGYWQHPVRWNAKAAAEGVRRRVFCASMADVFEDRDDLHAQRIRLWRLVEATPWLDWQLLTKRPENVHHLVMERWNLGVWPHNVWLGTTVEDREHAMERIPVLLGIPAAVRFLSCEPLLGEVHLTRWLYDGPERVAGIDWVIVGGESGPSHRPLDLRHARMLQRECEHAGVPFFFKQVGGATPKAGGKLLDGREHCEFPRSAVSA